MREKEVFSCFSVLIKISEKKVDLAIRSEFKVENSPFQEDLMHIAKLYEDEEEFRLK